MRDGALLTPSSPAEMEINLLSKAEDVRSQAMNQVGRHTFTIFMIPTFRVDTKREPLDEAIAESVKMALETAGYTVNLVDRVQEASGPCLVVQVDKLRNYLFSWLYPLGVVWGDMRLSLHLMQPDGQEIWDASTRGHGGLMLSLLYMSGFQTRVRSDLEANMNQVIDLVTSQEFESRLREGKQSTEHSRTNSTLHSRYQRVNGQPHFTTAN